MWASAPAKKSALPPCQEMLRNKRKRSQRTHLCGWPAPRGKGRGERTSPQVPQKPRSGLGRASARTRQGEALPRGGPKRLLHPFSLEGPDSRVALRRSITQQPGKRGSWGQTGTQSSPGPASPVAPGSDWPLCPVAMTASEDADASSLAPSHPSARPREGGGAGRVSMATEDAGVAGTHRLAWRPRRGSRWRRGHVGPGLGRAGGGGRS